jgi:hypothetical protein
MKPSVVVTAAAFALGPALSGCPDEPAASTPTSPSTAATATSAPATPAPASAAPAPTTPEWILCEAEIALQCDEGRVDGCNGDKTKMHICVEDDAKVGPTCPTQIVFDCPDGQVDGCSLKPPVADNHVCVYP